MFDTLQDWFLRKALAGEARKAGLAPRTLSLSFGKVRYLVSTQPTAPRRTAVLMLHGAGTDKSGWLRLARQLRIERPLLIPDLPGHGESCADPALGYGIAAQAARVRELLHALEVERVHLVGNSMGAAIALQLAASQPALVASLVLIGAVGVQARESWLQAHIRRTGRNPMVQVRSRQDYADMLRIAMHQAPPVPRFVLSTLARQYQERLTLNEKIAQDITPELERGIDTSGIACPALIVWGREDRVSHVENAALLQRRLRAARLRILDGIGHVPMVEAPGQVAELCNEFFLKSSEPACA